MRFLVTLVFAALIGAVTPSDKVDDWAKKEMARRHITGMAIGVYQHGRPVKIGTYGLADLEQNVKVQRDTVFEICSISKQFTAASILLLQEDGKLKLDDPLSKYIDGTPASWSGITLRHLLTHTAGIGDYIFQIQADKLPLPNAIKALSTLPVKDAPGEAWDYSNEGYWLLGHVVEKASGKSLYTFLKQRIFDPLGMKHTQGNSSDAIIPHRARGYGWEGQGYVNRDRLTDVIGFGAGGISSTIDDLNTWSEALKHDRILKPASRAEMLTPGRLKSGEVGWNLMSQDGYGLGVLLSDIPGHRIEKHSGGWGDASAQLTRFLDDDLTVVMLTNVGGYEQRMYAGEMIGQLFLKDIHPPTFQPATTDPDPKQTAFVKQALDNLVKATYPKDTFSPCLAKTFEPGIQAISASLKPLGPLKSFGYIAHYPQGDRTIYLYRAGFSEPQVLQVTMTNDGKIDGFDLTPTLD